MCGFIHTLPTLWGWALRRLRRLLRTNAYAAMHKMACFESAAIVSECEKMTQGGRTVCYWYTKYPPGSLSASTVVSQRVCSQLLSRSVCGYSTIVAWCVRVIRQSSSSSPQTTIVGPTKDAWCVPSFRPCSHHRFETRTVPEPFQLPVFRPVPLRALVPERADHLAM